MEPVLYMYTLGRLYSLILLTATANMVIFQATMAEFTKNNSRARLPCKHNVTADRFHRVKWFRSSLDGTFENGDPALVSWDNTSNPFTNEKYGIDTSFSLVICNTSIQDEGVYRCFITINVSPYGVIHDVKLKVYALPWNGPMLQRVNDAFNCSVDRVYPLLYPHVEFNHEKYAVQNEDGTYNTSVSGSIQDIPSEWKAVSCSFPHLNYSKTSSLSLYSTTTVAYSTRGLATTLDYPSPRANNTSPVLIILSVAAVFAFFSSVGLLLWRRYKKARFHPSVTSTQIERNGMLHT